MEYLADRQRSILFITAVICALVISGAFLITSCRSNLAQSASTGRVTQPVATHTPNATAEPTPGLVISGKVLDEQGDGVENVQIYRSYSAYKGEVIATTDATGYYESGLYFIPGDEMVSVWAVKPGFSFEPENYYFRHYYGIELKELNFKAVQP